MSRITQLASYKEHLRKRYIRLMERSNDYMYIDEPLSDLSAFKAMKVLKKLNQVEYLQR